MPEQAALKLADLPVGAKKTVTVRDVKILLVRTEDDAKGAPVLFALEAECPHAKAPLEKGAVCNGRLVCPWHAGTFALETGQLLEPPPLRDLKRYPVRLQGEDILIDPTPLATPTPAPAGQGKHLVFAGAGAATAAALGFLRDAGFAGQVTVIDPVMDEPIDRTQLTKMSLAGKKPLNQLPIFASPDQTPPPAGREPLAPLQVRQIKAHVTGLDLHASTITVGDRTEAFDALLLATGSEPKRLHIPGADLPHVLTIRHTVDLRRIDALLGPEKDADNQGKDQKNKADAQDETEQAGGNKPQQEAEPSGKGKSAVLIGDSFIAFEAASALTQRGLKVTVVAQSDVPFAKKFGPVVAHGMLQLHKSKGVTVLPNTEAVAITDKQVEIKDRSGPALGDKLDADLVIVAIGVEPTVDYAPDLPKAEKGGFALGRTLRLAPRVWAAGDIAAIDGLRIEHWRWAEQHGRNAAEAMFAAATDNVHGPAQPFDGVPFFWTFHFGKRLGYAGHADQWDSIQYDGDPLQLDFLAYYVKDGKVAAVLGCGRDTAIASLMEPLRRPITLEEARRLTAA